ncbi:hypothetical protein DPX16_16878 [Anabarilius grahami]|uniref:Uncharacterized protein n=1 Tax=Anabarilius grahami TaxID=495550 RepID=A0A3N0XPZ0_ANAGA|nr:hypothetical protein DPX16_16878 [Anabarilius grahami]
MALDHSRPGESLNVAEGQRRRPTSRPFVPFAKPAQCMRGTGHLERSPEYPGDTHATEGGSASEDSSGETGTSHGEAPHSSQTICTPHREEQGQTYSRSGRLIKPRDRLNL